MDPQHPDIYLDHGATTPLDPEVAAGLGERFATVFGNPATPYGPGQVARRLLEESREALAQALGGRPEELVFTSGGTEALCLALFGLATGATPGRIAVSATEHSAVHGAAAWLAKHLGWAVDTIPPDPEGRVTPEALAAAVGPKTRVVAIMLANNEIGTVNDCSGLARVLAEAAPRARLVVDAVQAFCKVPLDVSALGADCVAVTAHKLHGPKGIGGLWTRVPLAPVFQGGGQERGIRGGTPSPPLAWGFAEAVRRHRADAGSAARMAALRDRLHSALAEAIPGLRLTGPAPGAGRLPHNLHVCVPGLPADPLVNALGAAGVCVSSSAACRSSGGGFSRVLTALGRSPADGAYVRLMVGRFTTEAEVDAGAARFVEAVRTLRPVYDR